MIRRESRASGYDLLYIDGRDDVLAYAETGTDNWNLILLGKHAGEHLSLEKVSEIMTAYVNLENKSGFCAP